MRRTKAGRTALLGGVIAVLTLGVVTAPALAFPNLTGMRLTLRDSEHDMELDVMTENGKPDKLRVQITGGTYKQYDCEDASKFIPLKKSPWARLDYVEKNRWTIRTKNPKMTRAFRKHTNQSFRYEVTKDGETQYETYTNTFSCDFGSGGTDGTRGTTETRGGGLSELGEATR